MDAQRLLPRGDGKSLSLGPQVDSAVEARPGTEMNIGWFTGLVEATGEIGSPTFTNCELLVLSSLSASEKIGTLARLDFSILTLTLTRFRPGSSRVD